MMYVFFNSRFKFLAKQKADDFAQGIISENVLTKSLTL